MSKRVATGPELDGILVVGKPTGPTSHDVVAIVRRLTDLLPHRLELRSTPGHGALFALELPVAPAGVRPEDGLARAAGLAVHERGGILVSDTLQTSDPHIYAVGDAALVHDALGNTAFVALAWGANRQGRLAAD